VADLIGTLQDLDRDSFGLDDDLVRSRRITGQVRGARGTTTAGTGSPATAISALAVAANTDRKYLFIQNVSNGELWIDFTIAAVTDEPSIRLIAGDAFIMEDNFISTEAVNIIRRTGTGEYTLKEG